MFSVVQILHNIYYFYYKQSWQDWANRRARSTAAAVTVSLLGCTGGRAMDREIPQRNLTLVYNKNVTDYIRLCEDTHHFVIIYFADGP